jgi:hypothetical protein
MNVLVRLMKGDEVEPEDLEGLSIEELVELGAAGAGGRRLLHLVTVKLNQLGVPYAEIGERINGVHESTASRWAKPTKPPGRRRQAQAGEGDDDE